MGSPVTGNDFTITNYSGGVCENFTVLINQANKLKEWFDWAFTSDGLSVTAEFAALFQTYFYPIGAPIWWPLSNVPANCVRAKGQSLLRAHTNATQLDGYPELFAVYGTKYGYLDNTHFNVIDLSERFLFGSSDNHVIGEAGGEETHQLDASESPGSSANHKHVFGRASFAQANDDYRFVIGTGNEVAANLNSLSIQGAGANDPQSAQPLSAAAGDYLVTGAPVTPPPTTVPHNNMPPYLTGEWLIKAR